MIATPNRGSSYADFLLDDVLGDKVVPALLQILEKLGIPGGGAAFEDLTTHRMKIFNENNPDDERVKYYSYGASFRPGILSSFRLSWSLLMDREGENDGMVSVESSKWGEYQGTLKNVNHMDLVGWTGKMRL